jgi:hypothetical protein
MSCYLPTLTNSYRFRWVEIWLGVFFPKNEHVVEQSEFAKQLLNELENFSSLDTLRDSDSDKALKAAYKRLWDINGGVQYKDHQVRIFQIITSALESMKPQQLLEAACFNPYDPNNCPKLKLKELESLYSNFLKMNSGGYLDFEHRSAEIFVSEMKKEGFGNSDFCPESFLARSCLHFLGAPDSESWVCPPDHEFEERMRVHPLYKYAARHWVSHFKQAGDRNKITKTASNVFKTGSKIFHTWFSIYAAANPSSISPNSTGLMAASYFGLEAVVQILLEEPDVNIDAKDNSGRTPLSWAAGGGHEAVVKLLLATGNADVNSKDRVDGRTPLSWAAENRHAAVVKLLLDRGAYVGSRDEDGATPLLIAAAHGDEAVIKLLLATGNADVDSWDKVGLTPLWWAARNGHEAVVKLLLDAGADVDPKAKISWAGMMGYGIVFGDDPGIPLQSAAENGHAAVVKLLQPAP